jgi:hypothetical protein
MGQFRNLMADNGKALRDRKITDLVPADLPADPEKAVAQAAADVTTRPDAAAGKVFRLAQDLATADAFMTAARRLVIAKANEPHYYKFPAALFEDCRLVSPAWRPHVLAATVYYLKGPDDPDSPVMRRAREALRPLGS